MSLAKIKQLERSLAKSLPTYKTIPKFLQEPVVEEYIDPDAYIDSEDSEGEEVAVSQSLLNYNKLTALESVEDVMRGKHLLIKQIVDYFLQDNENMELFTSHLRYKWTFQKIPGTDSEFKYIGGGNDGSAFLVESPIGKRLVMKVMDMLEIEDIQNNMREVHIMKQLGKHKHFLKYYSHFIKDDRFFIFMEYFEGEEFYTLKKTMKTEEKIELFKDICNTLMTLDKEHIIHQDLHGKNILVKGSDYRIIDFGYSLCFNKTKNDYCYGATEKVDIHMTWRQHHIGKFGKIHPYLSYIDLKLGDYYNVMNAFGIPLSDYNKETTTDKFREDLPGYYESYTKEALPTKIMDSIMSPVQTKPKKGTKKKSKKRPKKSKKKQ